jgi:hypothetical protein
MWANPIDMERPEHFLKLYRYKDLSDDRRAIEQVLVLSLRPEARERIVELIARSTARSWSATKTDKDWRTWIGNARTILCALAGEKGKR